MEKIIKAAIDRGASDLHIKAGDVFRARIDGKLVAMTKQALSPEQTRAIALRLISNEKIREKIDQMTDYDCSWGAPGIGRFRVNILRQRSTFMIVMRVIPYNVPGCDVMGRPPVYERIAATARGMVLVTGVTGSGKSSSLAAMMRHINETMEKHIVTLEEPIEFLHRDVRSSITQREVGTDTETFRLGLRAALRQDPDVIVLGELRDAETIDTAMKAAETGHLLLSTLHTPDAQTTIMRMISMFPPEEHDGVRLRLAEALHAVISQRLLPRMDGKGRVDACEVMIVPAHIRHLILQQQIEVIRLRFLPSEVPEGVWLSLVVALHAFFSLRLLPLMVGKCWVAACEFMIVAATIRDLILQQRIGEIRYFIAEGREQYGMQTFDQ